MVRVWLLRTTPYFMAQRAISASRWFVHFEQCCYWLCKNGYAAPCCFFFNFRRIYFMSLLWQARFFTTVNHLRDLPNLQVPEIAFAGRSNAGKSTAINLLCNQKKLAFASKTPGRTQHINYFSIGGSHVGQHRKDETRTDEIRALLVDLPGYGYAEVSGSAKLHWQGLLGDYVQTRPQLVALVLMMDARRPFTDLDVQMLQWFALTGKPVHCLLTKADKLNRNESTNALRMARTVLASYVDQDGKPFPFTAQLFSALKRTGIDEANDRILNLLNLHEEQVPSASNPLDNTMQESGNS
jgi:GTP-binding protein